MVGAGSAKADERGEMEKVEGAKSFIELLSSYVELSSAWLELIEGEEGRAYMVAEGIKEIHEEQGRLLAAVAPLRALAQKYPKGSTARNAIHFKIKDIYKESGRYEEALAELEAIASGD
jgi:hypothetical protein